MTELTTAARAAREVLASALAQTQAPGVAELDLAEPIARAMSSLHGIEASGGSRVGELAPCALQAVQEALALLQKSTNANLDSVTETVAEALGLVHRLSRLSGDVSPPHPVGRTSTPGVFSQASNGPAPVPLVRKAYEQPPPLPNRGTATAQQAPSQPAYEGYVPPLAGYGPLPSQQEPHRVPQQGSDNLQSASAQAVPVPSPSELAQQQVPEEDVAEYEAELSATSVSNFFLGLTGSDVLDSGGIFIATSHLPEIGKRVRLNVALPGGYSIRALGVVRWLRESSQDVDGAPPGFGAQITQLSDDGHRLVKRFVRNREPLLYDDL